MNKSVKVNFWLGKSSYWGFAPALTALLLALATSTAFAQTGSVLSPETQKAVAAFKAANPKWKDEFMPFEQDCIDGKTRDKQCEAGVKELLLLLEDEIRLAAKEAQVNAKEAQVNAKEAQVNALEARVNAASLMIDRVTVVVVVLELNNSIRLGNQARPSFAPLAKIRTPALQGDIAFLRAMDTKLTLKQMVDAQEIGKLQAILRNSAQEVLKIYETFSPEIQPHYEDSKTIATDALKYTIKAK